MQALFTSALGVASLVVLFLGACKKDSGTSPEVDTTKPLNAFACAAPAEGTNYSIYPLGSGGAGVGDVMPYYDAATNTSCIYYLRDIWNDATAQHHPVNAFTTSDFVSYAQTAAGEVLSSNSATCAQDFAIGTGSVVQRNGTYFFFYTGFNGNSCTGQKEGIMLATSTSPTQQFTKQTSFATLYAPSNLSYDFNDNFRDPFVYFDAASNQYLMLVTARKDVGGGNWKGVLAKYTSTNLLNWNYQGVFYDGGNDNFFNMECADLFKLGSTYYLLFSDQGSQQVVYRKSTSLNGPWSAPSGTSRLDGTGFYAAKHLTDKYGDTYLMGWVNRQDGSSDTGNRLYGGNLVVHKLYQQSNGDLAVTIPHTLKANLEAKPLALHVNAQAGTITTGAANTFTLASAAGSFLNSVVFDPIMATHFKVSTTVNYASAGKDFGFMLGACDNYNGFYSLRFIPSQNRFSLDKTDHRNVTTGSTTVDVPFQLSPNTDYKVDIVEENSVVVVYLNNTAALTCRVYRAPQSSWGLFADNATATFKNVTVTTSN
jgi:beta-fructofuranosidase